MTIQFLLPNGEISSMILAFRNEHKFLSNMYGPLSGELTLPEETVMNQFTDLDGYRQSTTLPAVEGFKTSENLYMAWKTLDYETRLRIRDMEPKKAKAFTYEVDFKKLLRWSYSDQSRLKAMRIALRQKFCSTLNPQMSEMLLTTGKALLIEGNTWNDTFFGFCLKTGQGSNHLGQLLMEQRTYLQSLDLPL